MFEDTVVIIHSNTEYHDIFRMCMERFIKYFPEIKICLTINDKTRILEELKGRFEFYKIYEYPEEMKFGTRVLKLVEMIDEEYILFHCDNNVLVDKVDRVGMRSFLDRMRTDSIDQLRFNCGNKERQVCWTSTTGIEYNGLYEIGSGYFFSLQPALWKRNSFHNFLIEVRNCTYGELEEPIGQNYVRNNCRNFLFSDLLYKYDTNAVPGDIHEIYTYIYPAVHPFAKHSWIDDPQNVYKLADRLSPFYKEKIQGIRKEQSLLNLPYTLLRNKYMSKVPIKLSSIGYAVSCDFSIYFDYAEQREIDLDTEYVRSLETNSTIYLYPHSFHFFEKVKQCCDILKEKNIRVNWYLTYEPVAPRDFLEELLLCANHIFITNNLYDHPQIHQLPLGIRDGDEAVPHHHGFSQTFLLEEAKKTVEKKNLCLLCYTDGAIQERIDCNTILGNAEFVLNLNKSTYEKQPSQHCGKVPVWINYEKTHESYYTLSPAGVGRATHRFFEAIYLRSIPIVLRSNTTFDRLYDIYPCLVVDSWSQVTQEFLEKNLESMTQLLNKFLEKNQFFLTDISDLQEYMIET